jgi:hypothetical protein
MQESSVASASLIATGKRLTQVLDARKVLLKSVLLQVVQRSSLSCTRVSVVSARAAVS